MKVVPKYFKFKIFFIFYRHISTEIWAGGALHVSGRICICDENSCMGCGDLSPKFHFFSG